MEAEQTWLVGIAERELALLLATLEERLDADTLDALIAGASLSDLRIPSNADLERLIERLRGFIGDEEG